MIEIYYKPKADGEFEQIADFKAGSWIYCKETNLEDLTKIAELTAIDLTDIRDSLDRFELPRIEKIDNTTLFFMRHPTETDFGLYTDTLTVILSPDYLVTIAPDRSESVEHLLATNISITTTEKSKLMLHLLLRITHDYMMNIKRIRQSILEHAKKMKIVDTSDIALMTKNEEILNQYLTALVSLRNAMKNVNDGRHLPLNEEEKELFQDIAIALQEAEDVCSVNIKSIRSQRDSYQIIFTNNVNRTIKLLTALTIIFHIPSITASLYGMNIPLPFQGTHNAFYIVLFLIITLSATVLLLFRRNRWL